MVSPKIGSLKMVSLKMVSPKIVPFKFFLIITSVPSLGNRLSGFRVFCNDWAPPSQGCQMVYLHTKNPNLGTVQRALKWKMSVYLVHLVYFTSTLYI
jgi:hypothetical protein